MNQIKYYWHKLWINYHTAMIESVDRENQDWIDVWSYHKQKRLKHKEMLKG